MQNIKLHQLEGFFQVAQLKNYTKAAQAFSYPIGQAAVYQQVQGLQQDLGVTLVHQAGPRRTELTPEGRALYNFILPFFSGLPRMLESISAGPAEPLILAADQFLATEALPAALLRLQRTHPAFAIRVQERSSAELIAALLAGEVDAGLTHLVAVPPGVQWLPLGKIGAALHIPRSHALAKSRKLPSADEIAKYPLIVYEAQSPGRMITEKLFRQLGKRLKIAAEVTFAHTMRAFVQAGIAPAFVPFLQPSAEHIRPFLDRNVISFDVSHALKNGALPFGLLYRTGMEDSKILRELIRAFKVP